MQKNEWQIGKNQSNLKTVAVDAKDIFFVTAVRLFFDRIIKLQMLYNNIVGRENNIQHIHRKNFFYSEHFEALSVLKGFIKETKTSGSRLKALIVVLSVMIDQEESLRPGVKNSQLRIVQFLINLKAFNKKSINGVNNLNLVNKINYFGWFPEINKLLIKCNYNSDCILKILKECNTNPQTVVLCGIDHKLFSFIIQMKTEEEFKSTVTIINQNQKILYLIIY
jgi:hypothetical protein